MTRRDKLAISLPSLVDMYINEPCDTCAEMVDDWKSFNPRLFRFEFDGQKWLTDRCWVLPESAFISIDDFTIDPLPEKSAKSAGEWLTQMRASSLVEGSETKFAAMFAVELTLAGCKVLAASPPVLTTGPPPHVIVHNDERVGLLMAHRNPTDTSTTVPVSDRAMRIFNALLATSRKRTDAALAAVHIDREWKALA